MSLLLLLFIILLLMALVFSFVPLLQRFALPCLAIAVLLLTILTGVLRLS